MVLIGTDTGVGPRSAVCRDPTTATITNIENGQGPLIDMKGRALSRITLWG